MKTALITFLWDKHLPALEAYLDRHPVDCLAVPVLDPDGQMAALAARRGIEVQTIVSFGRQRTERARRQRSAAHEDVRAALMAHLDGTSWAADVLTDDEPIDALRAVLVENARSGVRDSIRLLAGLYGLLETHHVELVVLAEDIMGHSTVTATWARLVGVPSLQVAHSLALVDPYTVHAHLLTDVLAVYGERGAEGYLDLGIDPQRLVATGNPAWDPYVSVRHDGPRLRAELGAKHAMADDRPVVVFATTWSADLTSFEDPDGHALTLDAFLAACGELERRGVAFTAVVKDRPPHVDIGFIHRLVAEHGVTSHVVATFDDGPAWVAAADVVVGVESNYLVEAMMCGTAAVTLVGEAVMPISVAFDADSGVVMADRHSLADRLQELLEDPDRRARQVERSASVIEYYHRGSGDGRSSERVAALMSELRSDGSTQQARRARSGQRRRQRVDRALDVLERKIGKQR